MLLFNFTCKIFTSFTAFKFLQFFLILHVYFHMSNFYILTFNFRSPRPQPHPPHHHTQKKTHKKNIVEPLNLNFFYIIDDFILFQGALVTSR